VVKKKAFLRALKVEVDDAAGTVDEELQECAQLASVPAVDSIVYETVKAEHLETAEFLHVLKEVAIDCSTFREFHECKRRAGLDISVWNQLEHGMHTPSSPSPPSGSAAARALGSIVNCCALALGLVRR
jgi:hypothetical protein